MFFFISFCLPSLLHNVHLTLSRTFLAIKLSPHRSLSGTILKITSIHLNGKYDLDMILKMYTLLFKKIPKMF